jgi:hypothetical protein
MKKHDKGTMNYDENGYYQFEIDEAKREKLFSKGHKASYIAGKVIGKTLYTIAFLAFMVLFVQEFTHWTNFDFYLLLRIGIGFFLLSIVCDSIFPHKPDGKTDWKKKGKDIVVKLIFVLIFAVAFREELFG